MQNEIFGHSISQKHRKTKGGRMNRYNLTERENDVMKYVAKGYDNKQICEKLFISESTLKTHLTGVYQKFSVSNENINRKPSMTRLRATLIYLGLAKYENWI